MERLLAQTHPLPLPDAPEPKWRYAALNECFVFADAFALAGQIALERPRRIVEVGSGFSSAVMLDARDHLAYPLDLTFIEPYPERLQSLFRPGDRESCRLLVEKVQNVPLDVFTSLESGDFLFIDSSHVAKAGSASAISYSGSCPP